jgi:NAD(P)-dependent dehydrogenase (short-subunit alcohol dehydrogenase family)
MQDLSGKVAVVTGAASGIGLGLTQSLLDAGMRVVMADIETSKLEDEAERLRSEGEVLAVTTDVSDIASVEKLRLATEEAFGPAHVVCNNAGVTSRKEFATGIPLEVWRWIVEVNLWGVIHGVLTFLPGMIERNEGNVVNSSSAAALFPGTMSAPYIMTKSAIVNLSMSLAYELDARGSAVHVSALLPGGRSNILDADRNWLDRFGKLEWPKLSEAGQKFDDWTRERMGDMQPTQAGEEVVDAIRHDRFWVGGTRMGRAAMADGSSRADFIASVWRSAVDGTDLPIVHTRGG